MNRTPGKKQSESQGRRLKIQKQEVTYIYPEKDKFYLSKASQSLENLKKMLGYIKTGRVKFEGQYKKSREKEALDYLQRTINEREQ